MLYCFREVKWQQGLHSRNLILGKCGRAALRSALYNSNQAVQDGLLFALQFWHWGPLFRPNGAGEGEWYWGSNFVIFGGWSGSILIVGWWVLVVWSGGSYLVGGVWVRAGGRGCCWHHPGSFFCGLSLVGFYWSCGVLLFAYWVCCAGCCWSVSHYRVYIWWFFGTD